MINLYTALGVSHEASLEQILDALDEQTDEALKKAVRTWLLDPAVRVQYDTHLRQAEPVFFEAQTSDAHALALYHPDYAALLGVVFLPSACYLHALNWQKLGNPKKAKQNQLIAIAFLVFMTLVVLLAVRLGIQIPLAMGLIWLFVWYYGLAKEQVALIKHELDGYTLKDWYEPILLTVIAISVYGIFLIGVLALCELLGVL